MSRAMTSTATVAGALVLGVLGAAAPSAGTPPTDGFQLVKLCPTADDPAACDIVDASEPFRQLIGGRISYEDRVYWENPAGFTFEIARVTLTTGDDSGMVMGQIRWLQDSGKFTLRQGAGSLTGLHASGTVEYTGDRDGRAEFTVAGTYHLQP